MMALSIVYAEFRKLFCGRPICQILFGLLVSIAIKSDELLKSIKADCPNPYTDKMRASEIANSVFVVKK